jgi:septal ring factor EnvC (AmiA/AmiB activator)
LEAIAAAACRASYAVDSFTLFAWQSLLFYHVAMNYADELHSLEARALHDTDEVKRLLKEIAVLSGTVRTLQNEIEEEREKRQEVEARLAALEARKATDTAE